MNDICRKTQVIILIGEIFMGNIISILQEIFMMKEDNSSKVGLSSFKDSITPAERPQRSSNAPKELKLSELMRKGSY